MFRIRTNNHYCSFSTNNTTIITDFFYRCSYFHFFFLFLKNKTVFKQIHKTFDAFLFKNLNSYYILLFLLESYLLLFRSHLTKIKKLSSLCKAHSFLLHFLVFPPLIAKLYLIRKENEDVG